MDALILSCGTGGGHNAAGRAVMERLEARGHGVTMLDPYTLAGGSLDRKVSNAYIRLAQKTPRLFGCVYRLGEWYRKLPIPSPVYEVNKAMGPKLEAYLKENHFDVILMPHLYPGEILTYLKKQGVSLPKTIFISTDYTCIPFTEELDCDCYITPSPELEAEYIARGIPKEKLHPLGIPVSRDFEGDLTREEAADCLGLPRDKRYLLLAGGSIGAGGVEKAISALDGYLREHPEYQLLVVCGSNAPLLQGLERRFGKDPRITLLGATAHMAWYLRVCDVFLSKPGGLSSTEAAVMGVPLIHLAPIPGCELKNMAFFRERSMSIALGKDLRSLPAALERLEEPPAREEMRRRQAAGIPGHSAEAICRLAEKITGSGPEV